MMRRVIVFPAAASGLWVQDMGHVAQVASVTVDGGVCRRIRTARPAETMVRDPAGGGDDFDFRDAPVCDSVCRLGALAGARD